MSLLEALILGIIQGITEFLPISSSGHLVLAEELLGLKVSTLKSFDVALHLGTLVSILAYFHQDFLHLAKTVLKFFFRKITLDKNVEKENRHLLICIIIGTIPAVIGGLLLEERIDEFFRSGPKVAVMMMLVAFIFLLAELPFFKKEQKNITFKSALIIGISQSIALIPGVSRSGSTIATGLFLGIKRDAAARFSFLLGAVAIAGAGLLTALKLHESSETFLPTEIYLTGFLTSAISGYIAVRFLMKFLKHHSLNIFAFYRLAISLIYLL